MYNYKHSSGVTPIIVVLLLILVGAGAYLLGMQKNIFNFSPTKPAPSTIYTNPQANLITESVKLKVSTVGGGGNADPLDFTLNFKRETNDTSTITKRNENDLKYSPDYVRGYLDQNLVIKHGDVELTIEPVFEGTGNPFDKKLDVVVMSNPNTNGQLFRIKARDVFGPQYISSGFIYTTNYRDNPNDCDAFNSWPIESTPACIVSGTNVHFKNEWPIWISCSAEDESKAAWCDKVVASLEISAKKP